MAIEINQNLKKAKQSPVSNFFLVIGILLLILSVAGYFYLQNLNTKADSALNSAEEQIIQMRSDDFKNTEKEVLAWGTKIKDYNLLFSSHSAPSNIFSLLEKNAHPQVQWSNVAFLASSSSNSGSTIIRGVASDFISLQQQILILSKESLIQKINFKDVSFIKDGKISFELDITFFPEILNPIVVTLK